MVIINGIRLFIGRYIVSRSRNEVKVENCKAAPYSFHLLLQFIFDCTSMCNVYIFQMNILKQNISLKKFFTKCEIDKTFI